MKTSIRKWLINAFWIFLAIGLPSISRAQSPSVADFAAFAKSHDGDPAKGRVLFVGEKLACAKCHTTDGKGDKTGPDLSAIGNKFPRAELIRSILEPSAVIAVGYGTTVIETKAGENYQGVIKQTGDSWVSLMGADGKLTRFENRDIKGQKSSLLSLMPEGLQSGLTLAEFADLIGYLESLKQSPAPAKAEKLAETTTSISLSARPAEFPSFFSTNVVFKAPLWFGQVPGQTNQFIILEHGGKIWLATKTKTNDTQSLLVDLGPNIRWGPGCGLLGMAFHPDFQKNHKYYLQYQIEHDGKIFTLIAQRTLTPDGQHDSTKSRTIFEIPAATQDHTGGCIQFGPDHFLYICMGDTGPQKDTEGHGQDLNVLQAKMLRIDVDHAEGTNHYAIPSDNPYVNTPNVRPEIWATGFREPWRFSFDRATGDLWEGDVGQDKYEEVNIVRKGENYGWNVYEGFNPFSDKFRRPGVQYTPPVFSYAHNVGVSITGGYVYRGKLAPKFLGQYICADFQVQKVWALTQTNRVLQHVVEIGHAPNRVSSIAEDADGELYFTGYDSGCVYRIDLAAADPAPKAPPPVQ